MKIFEFFFEKFCRKEKSDYLCSPVRKQTPVKAEGEFEKGAKRNSVSEKVDKDSSFE